MVPIAASERVDSTSAVRRWLAIVVTVVGFLFGVQLLSTSTTALAPSIEATIRAVVTTGASALGASWLASYFLLNGSIVAAIAVSLFSAGLVTQGELFLLIAGSRLGAAGIVVLIGGFDYVQDRRQTIRRATSLGLLSFVVTFSVFLPATAIGYVVADWPRRVPATGLGGVRLSPLAILSPITTWVVEYAGAPIAFVTSLVVLFSVLRLFDRTLSNFEMDALASLSTRLLHRRWASFALGLGVTAATTSVAFSLGIVVPLYNRGYVTRDGVIPYILGASIGTFADTLLVALVIGTVVGVEIVLLLLAVVTVVTLIALVGYGRYRAAVCSLHDRLLADPRAFVAFLLAIVLVPLVLVVAG